MEIISTRTLIFCGVVLLLLIFAMSILIFGILTQILHSLGNQSYSRGMLFDVRTAQLKEQFDHTTNFLEEFSQKIEEIRENISSVQWVASRVEDHFLPYMSLEDRIKRRDGDLDEDAWAGYDEFNMQQNKKN